MAGKPQRPLLDETVRRVGGERPLMVGDRLDTDIEGAHNAGVDSLCVLTGVSGLADLVGGPRGAATDVPRADLGRPVRGARVPERDGDRAVLGGWTAEVRDGASASRARASRGTGGGSR